MDIGETGLAAQVAWLRFLSGTDAARTWHEGGGIAVVTGLASNSDNGIVLDRQGLRNESAVRSLLENVSAQEVPASLVLSEPVPDPEIELLLELGLSPENSANEMGRTIGPLPDVSLPPDVEIDEVIDRALLHAGLRALGTDWFDEAECLRYLDCYERLGYGPGHRLRHWVARKNGHVIAMATSFRFADVVTLMHCGVLEFERRRGIATALTAARLSTALDDGATKAVLSPSPDGYRLHTQLGFAVSAVPPNRWFHLPATGR